MKIAELLWPRRCLNCGTAIREAWLCDECLELIRPRMSTLRVQKGFNEISCNVLALNAYGDGWKKSMEDYKFRSAYRLSEGFGYLAAITLREFADIETYDIITFVPMTRKKVRARGYNQAMKLAESVAKELSLPCEMLLDKVKDNRTQHTLSRKERQKNVIGVYGTINENIKDKKIILIDDIITTGATLRECCSVLLEAGALEVTCLCMAYEERKHNAES
ncbi:MAG: phosphoribosyltransferase family protein [Clostridia bacterium]|nr:phosphoribosyltransferase family protein [Clostridia bacterium]